MKLNARLAMIAERIPECRILSDIGTDHAYIPIYAVENGICNKSLAADLREGPLEIARSNIKKRGLEKYIGTRLGNGLEPISLEECDVVVIAGMGGSLIRDILSESAEKAHNAELLLLQPNNAADVLRKWLCENGFQICDESLAFDAGKLYCLISAKWTGKAILKDDYAYYIGDVLLQSKNPLLHRYIEKKMKELDVVIAGRSKSRAEKVRDANNTSIMASMNTEKCIDVRKRLEAFLKTIEGRNDDGWR